MLLTGSHSTCLHSDVSLPSISGSLLAQLPAPKGGWEAPGAAPEGGSPGDTLTPQIQPPSAGARGSAALRAGAKQRAGGFSGFGRPNPEQQPSTPAHSALGALGSRGTEDGPKHSPPLLERAGGARAAFPESWRRFNLGPNCETTSGGGRSVVLEPCTEESPHAMNRYINVVYYLCNLILIYTIVGDCSVIQNKYISSLAPSVFNLGVPLSPRSPHKSWHCGTALPICVGCNNS